MQGALTELQQIVTVRTDGIKLLGSAVQGECETVLGPFQLAVQPAADRVAKAVAVATAIRQLAQLPEHPKLLGALWAVLSRSVVAALLYDARLVPYGGLHSSVLGNP